MSMTDFPNGITSFGIPVLGSGIETLKKKSANVYFVDKTNGNDSYDGKSADRAFATIAKAVTIVNARINWSASPWAKGDVIVIAQGSYAENLTALPFGATIIGMGDCFDADGENGVKIKPASGKPVDVDSLINTKIINVGFESADTSRIFDAAILNNVQIIHCQFRGAPEATTSTAGIYTNDSVALTVRDCFISYVDAGIDFVYVDAGDSVTRCLIQNNVITYCSEAGIRVSANLVSPASHFDGNVIDGGSGTLAKGIDNNMTTPVVYVSRNIISATDGIEGYTTGTYVGGNYCNGVLE